MRLLFLLAISPTAASAATLSVGPGLTYTTISEALDAAADGDRIEVAGGVYQEVLEIDIDVEIVGDSNQPVELGSANSVPTLIDIDDAVVHLENLQIDGSTTARAINVQSAEVSLVNVQVTDVFSTLSGPAMGIIDSVVEVTDSTFVNNSAGSGDGGHIYAENATLTVTRSVFEEGEARRGGAIAAIDTELTLGTSEFALNFVEGDFSNESAGGALYLTRGSISDTDSTFAANGTDEWGAGGAFAAFETTVTLDGTLFEGNESGQDGGVFFVDNVTLAFSNVESVDNAANFSGGVGFLLGSTYEDDGGNHHDNYAAGNQVGNNFSGSGGAFWLEDGGASFLSAEISRNLSENTGGGFFLRNAALTLEAVVAEENVSEYGGFLYVSDTVEVEISDSELLNNEAIESGGAIRWRNPARDGNLTITGSLLQGNDAGAFGGVVAINEAASVTLTDNELYGNTAADGGAVSIFAVAEALGNRNYFCSNDAGDEGGALRLSSVGSTTNKWNANIFVENAAPNGGAAISLNSESSFWNNHFLGNDGDTGAAVRLDNSTGQFVNNLVAWSVGAEAVTSNNTQNLTVSYNNFWENAAGDLGGALTTAPLPNNLFEDPRLSSYSQNGNCGDDALYPVAGSPLIDAGDPSLSDSDGSPSDIGAYGGPEGYIPEITDNDGDGFDSDTDCDDNDPSVNPDAIETCDGQDNDCDGVIDGPTSDNAQTVYTDADGDGFGDPATGAQGCPGIDGIVDQTDCDDSTETTNPAADEFCDGEDNDCNGTVDDVTNPPTWWTDADGDGFGDPSAATSSCEQPSDAVDNDADCNDADPSINPGADEQCDGIDEDCNGIPDDDAVDATEWYADDDEDGFGSAVTTSACTQPDGYTARAGDCNDDDPSFYPGAPEACDAEEDFNCDGSVGDVDRDGDGFVACEECDDGNADINPDAEEIWYDGIDQDCDGESDFDQDGDGFDALEYSGTDCDDLDPEVNPDAADELGDELDTNCDGVDGGGAVRPEFINEDLKPSCGCASTTGSRGSLVALGVLLLVRRRS